MNNIRGIKNLIKIISSLAVFALFCSLSTFKSDAKVIQTDEGDKTITVSWTNETVTDYSIGFAKITDKDNGRAAAKAMADSKSRVIPAGTMSYKITGLENNAMYCVCLNYGTSSAAYNSEYNDGACTRLTGVKGLRLQRWWKNINKVELTWDKPASVYGDIKYEVMLMDSSGKKIIDDDSNVFTNDYMHNVNNKKIYCVKVRAIHTPDMNSSTCPTSVTPWSDKIYVFSQPTVTSASVSGGKLKVNWQKISKVDSYSVYVSTKNGDYKKAGTVNGKKKGMTIKTLNGAAFSSSKTYYVYVVAEKSAGGKNYSSDIIYTYQIKGYGKPVSKKKK